MLLTPTLITAPTLEPVSLEDAKAQCKIEHDDQDAELELFIQAAREDVEVATGRQLVGATWEVRLDGWPCSDLIVLPRPPLISVTSVKYLDTDGTLQTLDTSVYTVHTYAGPRCRRGAISLQDGQSWPTTQPVRDAVRIRFEAGYVASSETDQAVVSAAIPGAIRLAVLRLVHEYNAQRGDLVVGASVATLPRSVEQILWPFYVVE